jgi:intracellular sulfur oxidation DsrE/DsrF family protein
MMVMKNITAYFVLLCFIFMCCLNSQADELAFEDEKQVKVPVFDSKPAQFHDTPYSDEQNVLFEFFLDEPQKINSALFWVRSYMNTLMAEPYARAPEFINVIILIHGTEIVTLAKKNYATYQQAVERLRYYEQLGVEIRVCGDAAKDYGYTANDFYSFVKIVPSAMTELAHWQSQGYPLIRPLVFEKKYSIEEIR